MSSLHKVRVIYVDCSIRYLEAGVWRNAYLVLFSVHPSNRTDLTEYPHLDKPLGKTSNAR